MDDFTDISRLLDEADAAMPEDRMVFTRDPLPVGGPYRIPGYAWLARVLTSRFEGGVWLQTIERWHE